MLPIKLEYQQCPNCKEYGLPIWRKTRAKYNPINQCPYCKNFYRVSLVVSIPLEIMMALGIGFLLLFLRDTFYIEVSAIIVLLTILIGYSLINYVVPFQKLYEDDISDRKKREAEKQAEEVLIKLRTQQVISKQNLFINLLISYVIVMIIALLSVEEFAAILELKSLALITTAIYVLVSIVCFVWRDKAENKWKSKRTSTYQVEQIDTEDHE